jgi:hypothetical protein
MMRSADAAIALPPLGRLHQFGSADLEDTPSVWSTAVTTVNLLNTWHYDFLHHPTCGPDLAPSDFRLFPKLKKHLEVCALYCTCYICECLKTGFRLLTKYLLFSVPENCCNGDILL